MSLESLLAGTSVGVGTISPFSTAVRWFPGIADAAGTRSGIEPTSEPLGQPAGQADRRRDAGAGARVEGHEPSGVVEIHDPRLFRPGREAFCRALAQSAVENLQARRVEVVLNASTCRLAFNPGDFDRAELARRAAAAVTAATPAMRERAAPPHHACAGWTNLTVMAPDTEMSLMQQPADHPRWFAANPVRTLHDQPRGARESSRLFELALAGGSLTMAVAGAILPGIPALPFLLMGARHAVRLSPRIDQLLRRQPWLAAILSQAEASGSPLRLDRRSLVKMLLITVVAAAVSLILHPPLPVILGLELGVMAFVCVRGAMERPGGREVALGVAA